VNIVRWIILLVLLNLGGCSFVATYNPSFDVELATVQSRLPGKALIYTTSSEGEYVFGGKPTSFTGGGTNLGIHLGVENRGQTTFSGQAESF